MLKRPHIPYTSIRALLSSVVVALILFVGVSAQPASAQSTTLAPNATVSGELNKLSALPAMLRGDACKAGDCVLKLSPIHVLVAVKGYAPMRVIFNEAEDTRNIRREGPNQSIYDIEERPILLRGLATVRHLDDGGVTSKIPVAGTIFRDDHALQLEVAVTHMNRRAPTQMVIAHVPLGADRIQGRAIRASSYAFPQEACGASHAHHPTRAGQSHSSLVSPYGATKLFYVATDFDREFMAKAKCKTPSKCNNKIVAFMNQASVFYQKPMSIRFKVERQQGPTQFTTGTADAGEMIDDYQSYIEGYYSSIFHDGVNTGSRLVDGFAGFTGRNMNNRVIGIATLGAYCDNTRSASASTVVRQASDSITPLVIAHEIGHNLNANHTASGIMAPSVSKVGKRAQFTRQSISEISSYANSWYEQCRAGVGFVPPPGSDPNPSSLEMTVGKDPGFDFSIHFSVENKRPNCKAVARASESAATVDQGVIVMEAEMLYSGIGRSVTFSTGINASNNSDATVYFKGYYVCSGDQVRAQSAVASFIVGHDSSYSPLISRSAWIDALREQLSL